MISLKIVLLRIIHSIIAIYFILCILYLYYTVFVFRADTFFYIATISLALEAFAVFILNNGNCPLIHVQRKIGDETPFFELFLPKKLAKQAIPLFARLTWIAVGLLVIRFVFHYFAR